MSHSRGSDTLAPLNIRPCLKGLQAVSRTLQPWFDKLYTADCKPFIHWPMSRKLRMVEKGLVGTAVLMLLLLWVAICAA